MEMEFETKTEKHLQTQIEYSDNTEIEKFSDENLQARIEYLADTEIKEFSNEQKLLLKNSVKLSRIKDLNNLPEDLPEELRELIKENKDEYIRFLSSIKNEDIEFKEENAKLYKTKFAPVIRSLKTKIENSSNPKDLSEYLGSGSNGSAYIIEMDNKKYAAKFSGSIVQANFETKPLLQAKGIKNTPQLVSYSFEDGVVIMELLCGTDVTNFTPENAPEYTDEHIVKLIEKTIELHERGINIDPKPSNFMYDDEEGFSVLDFHLINPKSTYSLAESIMSLRVALTERKWPRLDYNSDDYKEKGKEQSIERNKIYLPMMIRFITILKDKFPEILENWQKKYQEKENDPSICQTPPINREYIPSDIPELSGYLSELKKLGF